VSAEEETPVNPLDRLRPRYDVVIVGARAAGAATAMLLARRGLSVLAVDRGAYGSDTLSTHALMRAGVLQLARWGLLPRLEREGTPRISRTVFHYEDGAVDLAIKAKDGVPALFAPRPMTWGANTQTRVGLDAASWYDTAPLRNTLSELVDVRILNEAKTRLTVGAVRVRTSEMRYFDSREEPLGLEHIMASGALPPAFPAIRIDGEPYWDGMRAAARPRP